MASKEPLTPLEEFWENIVFRNKFNYSSHIFWLKLKGLCIVSHRQQTASTTRMRTHRARAMTAHQWAQLFYNADGGPQDCPPNRSNTQYLIPTLQQHYLIPSFGPHLITWMRIISSSSPASFMPFVCFWSALAVSKPFCPSPVTVIKLIQNRRQNP